MRTIRFSLAATALAGSLVLGGCNVFEGFYDDVASDDPVELLTSAQAALQQGDAQKAADLFKQAYASASAGSGAQAQAANGFATASFENAGVSVLTIDRLAQDLTTRFAGTSTPSNVPPTGICSFSLPERAGQEIALNSIDGYPALRTAVATIAETRQYFAAAYGLPANPGPSYNTATLVATMRARGMDDNAIGAALLNLTLAYTSTAFDRVVKSGGDQIRWYEVFPSSGDTYLGYCAPSLEVLNQVKREASCSLGDIGFSVALLKERVRLFPSGTLSGDLVAQAEEAYQHLSNEIGTACN